MLESITYYLIFGKPVIMYGGILTFVLMLATATLGYMVTKGKVKFIYHKYFAAATIILAIVHGVLGVLLFF